MEAIESMLDKTTFEAIKDTIEGRGLEQAELEKLNQVIRSYSLQKGEQMSTTQIRGLLKDGSYLTKSVDDVVAELVNVVPKPWIRNLEYTYEINTDDFLSLEYKGIVKVNSSGSDRPLTGAPNSYYKTGNGVHIFVYDANGKIIYDLSNIRVKSFKINVDPNGIEHYQQYKLIGPVPEEIKQIFGW